jgi:hypothetical protein
MSQDFDVDQVEAIPIANEQGTARFLASVVAVIGGSLQWNKELEVTVRGLHSGFRALSPALPAAAVWGERLRALLEVQPFVSTVGEKPAPLHPLALLLRGQPCVTTRHEAQACMAVGALVYYTLARGNKLSQNFLDALKQFYTSSAGHWESCRRRFQTGPGCLLANQDDDRDVVKAFATAVSLIQSEGMYAPVEVGEVARSHLLIKECAKHNDDAVDEETTAPSLARLPTRFRCDPHFELFEFQTVQEERQPTLGQFRLLNDANSLNEEEHAELWKNLRPQLRYDALPERLHVAVRLLSELCGISLEVLARVPFADVRELTSAGFRRGSLHIDLRVGLIRRDFLTVAPRADRDQARTHGRYLRTPIPPEILEVLRKARAGTPIARTIGDLLQAAALTPTVCHSLANKGRAQPRQFSDLRIARSFTGFLLRRDFHPSVISHTTGDITLVPRGHHYYLNLSQEHIYRAVNRLCTSIGLQPVPERSTYRRLGSPKYIPLERMRGCVLQLQQQVLRARNRITNRSSLAELVEFHNTFICSMTLQVHWAIGGRCQMLSTLSVAALLSNAHYILISDRASDRYSQMRLSVTTQVMRKSLLGLAEHLRTMGHRLMKKDEKGAAAALLRLVSGGSVQECAVPILYWTMNGYLSVRVPTREDLKKVLHQTRMPALNAPRHFLLSELVERGVDAIAIDAQLGHHMVAAAPFGLASGLTPGALTRAVEPVLTAIHSSIGLHPMVGLSSLQEDRWKLPPVQLGDHIDLPQNTYLRQSVNVVDFNPPDLILAEEDCPWTGSTLAAHAELMRLRTAYLQTDLVALFPSGAALFCLAAWDGVFSVSKARWILATTAAQGVHRLGDLYVVEQIDTSTAVQVLLHRFTAHALALRDTADDWKDAVSQLRDLLCRIDAQWSRLAEEPLVARLLALSAHVVHLETAPLERFCLVHKAPFIPVADLKRISGGPRQQQPTVAGTDRIPRRLGAQYAALFELLEHWADHDLRLGERTKRVNGALAELADLRELYTDFDEHIAIEWMHRELSNPPLRPLSFSTLRAYLRLTVPFFESIRMNESLPQSADEWLAVRELMFKRTPVAGSVDQGEKEAAHRRWAWQHLSAFLVASGVPIPRQALFRPPKAPVSYRPHLHVYVTSKELEQATVQLPSECLTPRDWIVSELKLRRCVPLRPLELRYLKATHLSPSGDWLVVTTSGHDHLKNTFARGLLQVPEHHRVALSLHMRRRRSALEAAAPAAFVPAREGGYQGYEASQAIARTALRHVTGRRGLRLYDLRACCLTDLIADPMPILKSLVAGEPRKLTESTASALHARGAVAAREGRHSNVVTTLRYYNLAGLLGAREQMNRALQSFTGSGKYLAAAHTVSRDVVYAAKSRGRPMDARGAQQDASRLIAAESSEQRDIPNPPNTYFSKRELLVARLHAGVLLLGGVALPSAADRAATESGQLGPVIDYVAAVDPNLRLHKSMALPHSVWSPLLPKLANWAASNAAAISQMLGASEILRIRKHNICVRDADALCRLGEIWRELRTAGLVAVFHPACTMRLADRAHLEPHLSRQGVLIRASVTRERVGRLSFSLEKSLAVGGVVSSGHVVGKTTSLVAHLMRMVVTFNSREDS